MLKNEKGITLIALIITIIVMLILVGVTVNVALNGGLFTKAEEAGGKTKISQIQEGLAIKKAEVLAEYDGKAPEDYGITIDKLNLPEQLKTEYRNKLVISKDAKLYYDASVVTNKEEQDTLKEMGIQEYVETNKGESYTFTFGDIIAIEGAQTSDMWFVIEPEDFWPEYVSEELKNSTMKRNAADGTEVITYNITYEGDLNYINILDAESVDGVPNAYGIMLNGGKIMFGFTSPDGNAIASNNYADYADLTFTITMAE